MSREVVVTGLGLVSPVGNNVPDAWDALVAGRSGIDRITRFDASGYEQPWGGEVKDFDPGEHVDAKLRRRIDISTVFAIAAAQEAVADAALEVNAEAPGAVGVMMGTGIGGAHLLVEQQRILDEKGPRRVSPFLISHMLPDTATGLVAIALGARGPNFAVTAACATGGAAVGEAAETIARGDAEVMIAGGFEAPLQPIYYAGFMAMKALAAHEDPTQAVRPFDRDRNGFILGEGAGMLILESREHAEARGARIHARWVAAATSNDALDMVAAAEDGRGIAEAMRRALARGELSPEQISYINAHGTGTPMNDRVETRAIRDVFREHADRLPVSSTKSMHGHLMGGAGALEAVITILTCKHQIVPPTINYTTPDPDCDLDYVPTVAREVPVEYAMSTSIGLGGHNSVLVFGRWEG
jgi:beta-ketoacyl-acyl-carrier-protein synthase II